MDSDRRRTVDVTPRRADLLAAEHDLDGVPPGVVPRRSIVVCAPPGVSVAPVADLLQRHGAGVPMEYFDVAAVAAPLSRRWRVINLDDYVTALHRHRSADTGVFGLVLRWHQLRRLHRSVAGLKQLTADRIELIVTTIAPNPTFMLIRGGEPRRRPAAAEGDDGRVDETAERVALLEATERAWLQWFDAISLRPLQVTVDPDGELAPPEAALVDALELRSVSRTGR